MAQASGLPHAGEQFNSDAQPHSVRRSLKPSLLRKFIEMKSRGDFILYLLYHIFYIFISYLLSFIIYFLSYKQGVGKAGWNTASPLSVSNYSFSEPKWINLTYYLLVPEFIYSWYDLSSKQYPSSPPLAVTTFEFITCWEIIVLQVWQSSDYPLKRWPRDNVVLTLLSCH